MMQKAIILLVALAVLVGVGGFVVLTIWDVPVAQQEVVAPAKAAPAP